MCNVWVAVASHVLEISKVMAIKFDTVTASVREMHQVLIILTLTFIQGHTDLNHENHKCLLILETVKGMPISFSVKIVRLKIYVIFCQSDDLALSLKVTTASQTWQFFHL